MEYRILPRCRYQNTYFLNQAVGLDKNYLEWSAGSAQGQGQACRERELLVLLVLGGLRA